MHEPDWQLLGRHLAGEATPDEEEIVRRWLAVDPRRRRLLDSLETVWRLSDAPPGRTAAEVETAWERLQARLNAEPRSRRNFARTLLRIAAVLTIAVPAGLIWRARVASPPPAAPVEWREMATDADERSRVDLPDGSQVLLGERSRLRYQPGAGRWARDVHLEGVGSFKVAPDSAQPFSVYAKGSVTRVLGTSFVVRAYPDDRSVKVGVAEGRVELRGVDGRPGTSAVLARGELGEMSTSGAVSVMAGSELGHFVDLTGGLFSFRNAPLPAVLAALGGWYDVDFQLGAPALARRRLTLSILDESLTEVLELISISLEVRSEKQGRTVTFYPVRRR